MSNDEPDQPANEPAVDEPVEDVAVEDISDVNAGSFCVGTVGSAGCPSSAGTIGTASSH